MDLAEASAEDFNQLLNESFSIGVDDVEELVLTEVESKARMRDGGRQPFALIFRGPGDIVLPQRIYRLEHESTGPLDIFLVPVGQEDDHVLYEAVFA